MEKAFAAAFEEWLNRYNSDPDQFAKEFGESGEYGANCAAYFIGILNNLSKGKPWNTIGISATDEIAGPGLSVDVLGKIVVRK